MNVVRFTARVMTGVTYGVLGADAARQPGGRVDMAAPLLSKIRKVAPLPDDEAVVRTNGAVQAAAGAAMALGIAPRSSAMTLAVSLVPTTIAGHAFWEIEDPQARKLQRTQFLKNVAMIAGLLFGALGDDNSVLAVPPKTWR